MMFSAKHRSMSHGTGGTHPRVPALVCGAVILAAIAAVTAPAAAAPTLPAGGLAIPLSTPGPPTVEGLTPDSGRTKGGRHIRIVGTNLSGATAVAFGSMPATEVKAHSATVVTAVDPPGVGTVNVTVTTPEGTSAINPADQFSYVAPPPDVPKITPNAGPAAGGTVVTIFGLNLMYATAVEFGTVGATSFTVDSNKLITAVSPAESVGVVEVTVSTPYGNSGSTGCIVPRRPCDLRDHFKYIEPTITNVSPDTGSTGTTVTITGTGFAVGTTGTKIKFAGTPATSVDCASITTCTVVAPARGPGLVDVRASIDKRVTATSPADHFDYT